MPTFLLNLDCGGAKGIYQRHHIWTASKRRGYLTCYRGNTLPVVSLWQPGELSQVTCKPQAKCYRNIKQLQVQVHTTVVHYSGISVAHHRVICSATKATVWTTITVLAIRFRV